MSAWVLIDSRYFCALAAWIINGLLLGLIGLAAAHWLSRRPWFSAGWVPLAAGGVTAGCGYVAFWAYFASPTLGKIYSVGLLAAAALAAWRRGRLPPTIRGEWLATARLQIGIGIFYLSLLHLFATHLGWYELAANRLIPGLPMDNWLPHEFAQRLYHGTSLKPFVGDWLSSDRAPLQSGWMLLTWPVTAALGLDDKISSGTAAIWFQLLWVPAAYGLFRSLGLAARRASAWTFALSLSGFFLMHTTYTWPKLAAGALVCGAFGAWVLPPREERPAGPGPAGAALAALACLAHSGAAFSLLPLAPWIAWRSLRGEWRTWAGAAAVFLLLALPWMAYQHFYDPPGNRLIKWHLAGQVAIDSRGTLQTLRENYEARGWSGTMAAWMKNLEIQPLGHLRRLLHVSRAEAVERRNEEFYYTIRALTWWPAGAACLVLALLRPEARSRLREHRRAYLHLLTWAGATLLVWCLLMFTPAQAIVHQGSFGAMIAWFVLFSALMELAGAWAFFGLLALQSTTLVTTWVGSNPTVHGPCDVPAAAMALAAFGWLLQAACRRKPPCQPQTES